MSGTDPGGTMKPLLASLVATLALAGTAAPAAAQSSALPAEVRAKIAEMGPVLTPDLIRTTMEMFAPLAKPTAGTVLVVSAGMTLSSAVSLVTAPQPLVTTTV